MLRFNRLQLLPEEDLNPLGRPDGNPGAEEVGVFRPDALRKEWRQMLFRIVESNVGRKEADALGSPGIEQFADPAPEQGANQDVRIENDHLVGTFFRRRCSRNSRVSASSSTSESALARRSAAALSSEISAGLGPFRRVGT